MTTIAERVARGAAFLDEREPGWDARIDLDTLSLDSPCCCVLGQLHGGYGAGLRATGLGDDDGRDIELGFFWTDEHLVGFSLDDEPGDLTAEWKRVITARRESGAS